MADDDDDNDNDDGNIGANVVASVSFVVGKVSTTSFNNGL